MRAWIAYSLIFLFSGVITASEAPEPSKFVQRCREWIDKLHRGSDSIYKVYGRFTRTVDPHGSVRQLIVKNFKNPSSMRKAIAKAGYSIKGDLPREQLAFLKVVKTSSYTLLFSNLDSIREFLRISKVENPDLLEPQAGDPTVKDFIHYIVRQIEAKSFGGNSKMKSILDRVGYAVKRQTIILTGIVAAIISLQFITVNSEALRNFLDPVYQQIFGVLKKTGYRLFNPVIDGIKSGGRSLTQESQSLFEKFADLEKQSKQDNADAESVKVLQLEFHKLLKRWANVFNQYYQNLSAVEAAGQLIDYNAQNWIDLLMVMNVNMEDVIWNLKKEISILDQKLKTPGLSANDKDLLNAERTLNIQRLEEKQKQFRTTLARTIYVIYSFYPPAAAENADAKLFTDAMGFQRMVQTAGGQYEMMKTFREVFHKETKKFLENTN